MKVLMVCYDDKQGEVKLYGDLAIEEAVKIPILRPLIGFDKQEIIAKAREIGTYEISIAPHQDCCSRFLPQYPETNANLTEVKKEEKKLNVGKLVRAAVEDAQLRITK